MSAAAALLRRATAAIAAGPLAAFTSRPEAVRASAARIRRAALRPGGLAALADGDRALAAHIAEHHGEPALAAAIAPSLMAQMMARLDYKAIRPATVPAWAALLPSGTAHRQVPLQLDAGPSARLSAAQPEPATPAQKEEH